MNSELLKRLGPLKNQFLVFICIVLLGLLHYANELTNNEVKALRPYGVLLLFAVLAIFSVTVGFYLYALVKLPGSRLEYMFAEDATNMVSEHKAKNSRAAKR
jgi:drug/metabolite transporter (DMT)-like permease